LYMYTGFCFILFLIFFCGMGPPALNLRSSLIVVVQALLLLLLLLILRNIIIIIIIIIVLLAISELLVRLPKLSHESPHPVGHTHSRFSVAGILLVTHTVYSHSLASYWSHTQYILSRWHPIGHTHSIFSVAGILLVTHTVNFQSLASYW
jgi:hypothetical protein